MARCSGDLLSPSPPAEKAATSSDEAGKPSASDGAGNGISIKLRNKDVPRIGDDILDRGVQKLRIGWEGDVLGLHGGIDRDPRQILRPQRPALVRHPQALGQEKFQLAAEALAPMAQVRALVRKLVLEELLSGEVLEVWIIDPAFAHAFVGQSVNMLEQKKPDHKNCVAIPGRPPSLYSGAISPSMNSQSILPASCTSSCLMLMIWSSRARSRSPDPVVSCFFGRIAPSDAATESCFSIRGNRENELQASKASDTETLQSQVNKAAKKRLSLSGLEILHGRQDMVHKILRD